MVEPAAPPNPRLQARVIGPRMTAEQRSDRLQLDAAAGSSRPALSSAILATTLGGRLTPRAAAAEAGEAAAGAEPEDAAAAAEAGRASPLLSEAEVALQQRREAAAARRAARAADREKREARRGGPQAERGRESRRFVGAGGAAMSRPAAPEQSPPRKSILGRASARGSTAGTPDLLAESVSTTQIRANRVNI